MRRGRAGHATHVVVTEDLVILVVVCSRILIIVHACMRTSHAATQPLRKTTDVRLCHLWIVDSGISIVMSSLFFFELTTTKERSTFCTEKN